MLPTQCLLQPRMIGYWCTFISNWMYFCLVGLKSVIYIYACVLLSVIEKYRFKLYDELRPYKTNDKSTL